MAAQEGVAAPTSSRIRARAAVAAGIAAVGSVIAAEIVGIVGKAAGAAHVTQLTPAPLAMLTIIGVVVGTAAWVVIGRRNPTLLTRLVPIVLVLSFIPDLALGAGGTAWSAVVTLMIAHAAVFAVTVPVLLTRLRPADLDG